jgi:hypothetical protein
MFEDYELKVGNTNAKTYKVWNEGTEVEESKA